MRSAIAFALVAVLACSDKKPTPTPTPEPGSAAPVTATTPATTATECEKLLAATTRKTYLADAAISDVGPGSCVMKPADKSWRGSVSVVCDDLTADDVEGQGAMLEKTHKATRVTGVGKGAWVVSFRGEGAPADEQMVHAWDDNSNCMIQVRVPATFDGPGIARDVLAVLPLK